jgi:radical SAM superfamily enzyme
MEAIRLKPSHVSVQRISAGIDDESLIAPLWCKDKNGQLRSINKVLKSAGLKY